MVWVFADLDSARAFHKYGDVAVHWTDESSKSMGNVNPSSEFARPKSVCQLPVCMSRLTLKSEQSNPLEAWFQLSILTLPIAKGMKCEQKRSKRFGARNSSGPGISANRQWTTTIRRFGPRPKQCSCTQQ